MSNNHQAVSVIHEQQAAVSVTSSSSGFYFDVQKFAHAQRVANMFAQSTMVPEQFRNNIGNCMIALNLADRYRLDPFMVMQKMYVIHGRPGIEAQLAIALINASGKFTPLEFVLTGEGDSRQCVAVATKKSDGQRLTGPAASIKMAKDEGWYSKNGSKWKTMPDLMLTYRSATFFGRIYAPETLLGFATDDEIIDIQPTPAAPRQPAIDVKAIGRGADMSIYRPASTPAPAEKHVADVIDIPPEPVKQAADPEAYDKAIIRLHELSADHQKLIDRFMAGRNPDIMTSDELWGVIDAVEDELK